MSSEHFNTIRGRNEPEQEGPVGANDFDLPRSGGEDVEHSTETFGGEDEPVHAETFGGDDSEPVHTEMFGGDDSEPVHEEHFGGDEEEHFSGGLAVKQLSERLLNTRKELISLINEFVQSFNKDVNQVAESCEKLADEFGRSLKYTDDVLVFINTFTGLKQFISDDRLKNKLYQHLLEINVDDVGSREIKSSFIQLVNLIISKAEAMGNTAGVKELVNSLNSIERHVNQSSDKIKTIQERVRKDGGSTLDVINELYSTSGAKINISGLFNGLQKLDESIKRVSFYKDIAVFRSNLTHTSKELGEYSKSYPEMVGKTIGNVISKLKNEYAELIHQINDNKAGMGLEIDLYNSTAADGQKISKEQLKMVYQWQCDARIGLYKTIEAVDLYLYHFTDAVAKNPDAVSDLHKMLTATKIIAKWYDIEAGNNLVRVFESFKYADGSLEQAKSHDKLLDTDDFFKSGNDQYNNAGYILADLSTKLDPVRLQETITRCKKAVEGITVLKNVISYFVSLGEKYGDKNSEKNIYMSPGVIYKNLVNYIWASAFNINVTGTEVMDNNNNVKRLITIEDTKASMAMVNGTDPENVGIHSNSYDLLKLKILRAQNDVDNFKRNVSSLDKFGVSQLKNLVTSLHSKFIKDVPYLTILNAEFILSDYNNGQSDSDIQSYFDSTTIGFVSGLLGDSAALSAVMVKTKLDKVINKLWTNYKNSNSNNLFAVDDNYFVLLLKSMTAKVLAVAGINRIYKDPKDFSNNIFQNRTRMIMGGVITDNTVIDEAAELYIRLPLLAEFYYKVFNNGNAGFKDGSTTTNLDNEQISFVPEVGSIWSGLISIIFDKSKYISSGLYTQDNLQKIIVEINAIYKHFKALHSDSATLTRFIVMEFVAEVNRRYGVIKRDELSNYYKLISSAKKDTYSNSVNESVYTSNDFDILNDADEFSKSSPSDKFVELKAHLDNTNVSLDEKISKLTDYKIVKDFRNRVETVLSGYSSSLNTRNDITNQIRALKKSLKVVGSGATGGGADDNDSTESKKFNLIIRAMETTGMVNNQSDVNSYVCFNELVLTPLTILSQVDSVIKSFMDQFFYCAKQWSQKNSLSRYLGTSENSKLNTFVQSYEVQTTEDVHKTFIQSLTNISNSFSGLVRLRITSSNKIILDVSELQKEIEYLLASVKTMASKFNGLLSPTVLKMVNDPSKHGSIYWLENELLSKSFNKITYKDASTNYANFDVVTNLMSFMVDTFNSTNLSLSVIHDNILFSGILYTTNPLNTTKPLNATTTLVKDVLKPYNQSLKSFTSSVTPYVFSAALCDPTLTELNFNNHHGMIQEFNTLIFQYVNQLYDVNNKKLYSKLFEQFMSGQFSTDINDGNCYIDIAVTAPSNFINPNVPYGKSILSSTIALIMKLVSTKINPLTGVKVLDISSISEISPSMLEQYKVKLPVFIRLFKLFIDKCKVYRRLLSNIKPTFVQSNVDFTSNKPIINNPTQIDTMTAGTPAKSTDSFTYGETFTPVPIGNDQVKSLLMVMFDNMINGMGSLLSDAELVHNEMKSVDSTVPVFFDIRKDFTKNFMNTTKELPFAPLSMITTVYNNSASSYLLPARDSNQNKYNYGMRAIVYGKEFNLKDLPYMQQFIKSYNNALSQINVIEDSKINDMLKHVTKLYHFTLDSQIFNGCLSTLKNIPVTRNLRTFEAGFGLLDSILLVEGINSDQSKQRIFEFVKLIGTTPKGPYGGTRKKNKISRNLRSQIQANQETKEETKDDEEKDGEDLKDNDQQVINVTERDDDSNSSNNSGRDSDIISNLLDLDIIPINVHSLMREIPLVNIYNYAITYDEYVIDMTKSGNSPTMPLNSPTMPLALNPYYTVTKSKLKSFAKDVINNYNGFSADILSQLYERISYANNELMSQRMNTKLTRNILFIITLQQIIKRRVKQEIEFINTKVVSNTAAVSDLIGVARYNFDDSDNTKLDPNAIIDFDF